MPVCKDMLYKARLKKFAVTVTGVLSQIVSTKQCGKVNRWVTTNLSYGLYE